MKPRPGEKRENWLLRKVKDAHAQTDDALVEQGLTSVLTGRTMAEIEADKGGTHPLGQTLVVTRGHGYVQQWGSRPSGSGRAMWSGSAPALNIGSAQGLIKL